MNTDLMFSSKTDLWATPQDLFDQLNKEFHFTLDVCATDENAKCKKYYTKDLDGLKQDWVDLETNGAVWCNPPYGRQIGEWVKRAYWQSVEFGSTIVMLLPARTDTRWFHDYIYNKDGVQIRFLKGRLKFGESKKSAPFPSMVVIFKL